jgi:hypothetical protein
MTTRHKLEQKLRVQNAVYWYFHGEDDMASKPCAIHGYVDKDYDGCIGCRQCTEGK